MGVDRERPVGAGKAYGWGQAQQCSMFYITPCVQHSWAVMFSVTQEELFPMAMDETLGSCVDIILSVVHF